ncbi:MAG: hypothetical protein SCARUB_03902 [Candidatus Scalindua rubra]|uniref:Alginate export domain-containing protein n=1 Tax=Candidatus Scalindua rubra TaxID=1872076 RepID=A0A1E3X5Z3_9BACT|nr:MAG: hypothetical protein SCARUB_03902 [Candidatus Scalindua rubra]
MNIQANKIMFSAKPSKKLLLKADLWFFEADERLDAWYTVGGDVRVGSAGASTDDDYGQELDITAKYKLFKNFGVVAGYSHYFVDDFIEDFANGGIGGTLNRDSDTDWAYLMTTMKF